MLLGNLLKNIKKKYSKISVTGISFDSRKTKRGNIFFSIDGHKTSGSKYIMEALARGASAVVSNKKIKYINSTSPLILVKDVRKSLSEACSKIYKEKPKKCIIAVTGTNGKSSVADFFCQILNFNKLSVASIGTLGILSKKYKKKTKLTSIDPLSLHKNLQLLTRKKINYVILEASSHGLKQKRLNNINIKIGVFTNLSHDHLDYHKNIKSYLNSKMYLFKNLLKKNSIIITDEENSEFKIIKKVAKNRNLVLDTIGSRSGKIKILSKVFKEKKQIITISVDSKIFKLQIPLIGYFQVKNLLMAVLAAKNCGLNLNKIFEKIHKIKAVPGRLECVASLKNNSNILVDFAHTPDALEQSLIALKNQFKKDIVIVFGCGGERDKKKRSIMGKIAAKYCRKIFVTDDNPRNESPKKIREAIIKGCKKQAFNIANRKIAIATAINEMNSNEILLVSGKGHEETQDYGNKIIKFSDKKIIKKIIKQKTFSHNINDRTMNIAKSVFNRKHLKNMHFKGVSINTKTIKKNNLFFAIKGKKLDGHKFAKEAIDKGAAKIVVNRIINQIPKKKTIKVKNTFSCLNNLAKVTRDNTNAQIIGITGSSGKTTLKNLVSFALSNYGKVHYSPHSYNNKFGVPISLSNLKSDTEYGIFEVGMDKKGEINNLSKIIKPEIAIITNISEAHLKNFNSLKDIARAKSEIINNILKGGNIILNKNDTFFNFLSNKALKNGIKVTSFGFKKNSNISLLNVIKNKNNYIVKVKVENKIFNFYTKYSNKNFLNNILACVSTMFVLNLNLEKMKKKFINFKIPEGRGDIRIVKKFSKKFKFIDESYNANPLSMKLAINNINNFKKSKKQRKLIFLSDMLELGNKSKKLHRKLSNVINKSDIDKVFVTGNHIKETFNNLSINKKGKIFKNLNEANENFGKILHNNDLLMVKGSNATGLNQFSKNIKKGE